MLTFSKSWKKKLIYWIFYFVYIWIIYIYLFAVISKLYTEIVRYQSGIEIFHSKAMFVLTSNHFRKCFSVNVGVWLRMENKFSGNAFQLTVCFSWFDPEMVWSENFHFKPFLDSRAKRKREIAPRSRHEPRAQSPSTLHPSTSSFDFDFELHPDRTLRLRRWTQSPGSHTFYFAEITPQDRTDCTPGSHRDGTNRTEIAIEKWLGFDEFDRIWWIFFGWVCFCVYLLRNGIIYLFASWENVRNKKKMCFLYYFQQHNQTLENIFQSIF